jgi:PTS system fructose-specific IIA component
VRLSTLLPPSQIRIGLHARTKRDVIAELAGLLPLSDGARGDAVAAVLERESVLSTGIGRGVAVPHGKTSAVPGLLAALAVCADGLPFDAVDGLPCRIFFLLVSHPDDPAPHVRVLADVARLLNREEAKAALLAARSPEEAAAVFAPPADPA